MKEIKFEKANKDGVILRARFICPDEIKNKSALVIMLTGDGPKGSNSLSWVNLPPRLEKHGISTLLFDFAGLGNSNGERKSLTLSKGIDDFKIIFKELKSFDWIDHENIGIMASSFGANVALLCPEIMNQSKAIGLKSPSCFLPDAYINEISLEDYNDWINTGFCKENGYDISVLYDPFNYNTYDEIKKINTQCLITHGSKDEIIPTSQSLYVKHFWGGKVELEVFENGDHGYSKNDGKDWEKMACIFENFFKEHLT